MHIKTTTFNLVRQWAFPIIKINMAAKPEVLTTSLLLQSKRHSSAKMGLQSLPHVTLYTTSSDSGQHHPLLNIQDNGQ